MSTVTPDRQTFRATVAQVAERAKAILPAAVNGRVESAVKLVLQGAVGLLEDGSIQVGSSNDPTKSYQLVGTTCTCQDFQHGKAPEGWCQHRIAAGIDKRVREVLAARPVPPAEPLAPSLPEAPASVNVHLMISGRQVQLTLRDTDEVRLLARLAEVLQRFPQPAQAQPASPQGQGWCAKHQVPMQENVKAGRRWFSHRTADGWCKGR